MIDYATDGVPESLVASDLNAGDVLTLGQARDMSAASLRKRGLAFLHHGVGKVKIIRVKPGAATHSTGLVVESDFDRKIGNVLIMLKINASDRDMTRREGRLLKALEQYLAG